MDVCKSARMVPQKVQKLVGERNPFVKQVIIHSCLSLFTEWDRN